MKFEKPREIAIKLLREWRPQGAHLDALLERALARHAMDPPDRRLLQELVFGVLRWRRTLDWLIDRQRSGRLPRPPLPDLLRLGLYQILWLDRIPDHAAVHETVELAKGLGCGRQAGFLNALLRSYARDKSRTQELLSELKARDPGLGYSHPDWLVHRWSQRWGTGALQSLLAWNNRPPAAYARLNTLRTDAQQLTQAWAEEGVIFRPFQASWVPPGLVYELQSFPCLNGLPSFQRGWFYVQDPSTLLAVRELDPQPGERILDACAAPGGKTTFIAQIMRNQGRIVAQDAREERLNLLRENAARLGAGNVETRLVNGPAEVHSELFDRILLDVPCSNTGVLRRRVDLRWRLVEKEIGRLQSLQAKLLDQAAPRLKKGGVLVYSTCSLEPEENAGLVAGFLKRHPEFLLESERQLLPFADEVDGAYVARIKRAAP